MSLSRTPPAAARRLLAAAAAARPTLVRFAASSTSAPSSSGSSSLWPPRAAPAPTLRTYSLHASAPPSSASATSAATAAAAATSSLFGASTSAQQDATRPLVTPPDERRVRALAEADGVDPPEPIPLEEAFVWVTPAAWRQLAKIGARERKLPAGEGLLWFRVAVDSGGCHGYQYKMDLVGKQEPDDYVLHPPPSPLYPSPPLPLLIDPSSLHLLRQATLDFTTELIGSAFRIRENPQAKGSGCGCGVSWEAK